MPVLIGLINLDEEAPREAAGERMSDISNPPEAKIGAMPRFALVADALDLKAGKSECAGQMASARTS